MSCRVIVIVETFHEIQKLSKVVSQKASKQKQASDCKRTEFWSRMFEAMEI